jgi:alkanesulfonate monooxygenase SsuD/methylene tetrahydromethanopterin reductase-like flavin-dependent oxidoreductase (luciferase family)
MSDQRVSATLQNLERCRRLWRGEEPDVELLPSPHTLGGPPLWLGAHGPRLLRRAGGQFDGWLPFSPTPDDYAARWQVARQAAEQAGRNPGAVTAAAYLTISLADKPERATQELDTYMQAYYSLPGQVMAQIQACHAGTLESASEWIARYVASGARHLVLRNAA